MSQGWEWPVVILGILYFANVLWWEPRQVDRLRLAQQRHALKGLRKYLERASMEEPPHE